MKRRDLAPALLTAAFLLVLCATLPLPPMAGEAGPAESTRLAAHALDLPNAGFESGDLTGWIVGAGDVAVIANAPPPPCFQPDMPSEGTKMACLSNGSFFGGQANGGVRSDLVSGPIQIGFRPGTLRVKFSVDFQTEENARSAAYNDAFQARLVTGAGTFLILQIDTFGRTFPGRGLSVQGFEGLQPTLAACPLSGLRTGRLEVVYTRPIGAGERNLIGTGPVFLEFSIANQGDAERTSIACVDGIEVRASRP